MSWLPYWKSETSKPLSINSSSHQAALSIMWNSNYSIIDELINSKVGGSNAYPDPAPEKVGGSRPRKTHKIYAPAHGFWRRVWNGCMYVSLHFVRQRSPLYQHCTISIIRQRRCIPSIKLCSHRPVGRGGGALGAYAPPISKMLNKNTDTVHNTPCVEERSTFLRKTPLPHFTSCLRACHITWSELNWTDMQ